MTIKRIENHTDRELDDAIAEAVALFGSSQFYVMLHGIDAYMERRNRRRAKAALAKPDIQPSNADLVARIEAVEREIWYNIGSHK